MLNTQLKSSLVAISVATILSACGGGSSGTAVPSPTNVTSSGTITGFGSVIVNGKRFDTSTVQVVRDDGSVIEDSPNNDRLKEIVGEGNIVKVRGTSTDDNTGVANTITIDDELVGATTAIDDAALTFEVKGQTIFVTPDTIIDDTFIAANIDTAFGSITPTPTLSSFLTGVTVEVSGFPTDQGLEATRIESAGTTVGTGVIDEVKGFVDSITGNDLVINGLTITGLSSLPAGLTVGDLVEVHGNVVGTTMTATSIEVENQDDLLDDDFNEGEVEVEGMIQSITPTTGTAGTIVVNGIEFTVADISQFQVNMKIEIKAQLQNGSLQVIRIQDETEDNIRIRDQATGPASGGDISTRLGLTVAISDRSRLEFDDGMVTADIQSGTYIEARGFKVNGNIVWTRIEASNQDTKEECRLRGSVGASPSDPSLTIEGVTVTTDSNTQFRDANDAIIDSATFFNLVVEGDIVQSKSDSKGTGCNAGLNPAKEVSFEPEDDVLENNGGDDNGAGGDDVADNELKGAVSNVISGSFVISGETVSVNDDTMIDGSIIEDARGNVVEINNDLAFGDALVTETLDQLLNTDGTIYVVTVDRSSGSPVATLIEDF